MLIQRVHRTARLDPAFSMLIIHTRAVCIVIICIRSVPNLPPMRQGVIYELNGPDGSDTKLLLKARLAALYMFFCHSMQQSSRRLQAKWLVGS